MQKFVFSLLLIFTLQSLPLSFATAAGASSPTAAVGVLSPDALALLSFKASADIRSILYFSPRTGHCQWPGIKCTGGRVVRLVLENFPLRGAFAANTLSRLDQLRVLSLQNDSLSGPIPDLSALSNLKTLFLDHNSFSGNFPPSILSLHRIRTIDLSYNNLSGPIPYRLTSLDQIYCIRLQSNRFNGSVPPLNQSSLRIFNVSRNNLSGAVPATPILSGFGPSAFSSNPSLCGEPVRKQCRSISPFFSSSIAPNPPPTAPGQLQALVLPSPAKSGHKAGVLIGIGIGILLVIGLFLGVTTLGMKRLLKKRRISAAAAVTMAPEPAPAWDSSAGDGAAMEEAESPVSVASESKKKKRTQELEIGKSGALIFCAGEAQVYTLEQLMRGSAEMLGRGTVGTTYKAVLDNQLIVTVKRLDANKMGAVGKDWFEGHMDAVGNLRHPNLVPLRAFFQAKEERLLVYDYQPNGSLFSLIHSSRSARAKPLHWTSCLKIAEDVAQGLACIHQATRLIHGNIKSSNILLGPDFEACLTDYCLTVLVESSMDETDLGYRAPETRKSNWRATPKSDVYGFGMLLLELLTGRAPLEQPFLMSTDIVGWVRSVREEDEENEFDQLTSLVEIAIACTQPSPDQRPTTWQVLKMIQGVKEIEVDD